MNDKIIDNQNNYTEQLLKKADNNTFMTDEEQADYQELISYQQVDNQE